MPFYAKTSFYGTLSPYGAYSAIASTDFLNPFNADQGECQGRLDPANYLPEYSDYAYVLGTDCPPKKYKLNAGDNVEVLQNGDFDVTKTLFAKAFVRLPKEDLLAGWYWDISFGVDGTYHDPVILPRTSVSPNDGVIYFSNVGLPVSQVSAGAHDLKVRLRLQATAASVTGSSLFPVDFAGLDRTLIITVDGGSPQTINIPSADVTPGAATAQEVADIVNESIVGGFARSAAGELLIGSLTEGSGSSIAITGTLAGLVGAFVAIPVGGWTSSSDAVDIEVPSIYLDSFAFDETSQLVLLNQFPQPGDFDVDADILDLKFELAPTDGSSVSTAATIVKVDGATVYDGGSGGFQPGFSGTVVSSSFGSTIFTVSVLPFNFESEQDVVVEVDTESLGGQTLSTSYAFTIEDTEPAYIEDVCPISKTQVRVRFSEKVVSSSSLEANDALNPSNYTFTPVTFPAYTVTASSVEKVSPVEGLVDEDTVFIVTLNQETTKDAGYNLEVFNVEDEDGNAVEAPLSMYTFIAKWPETASNRDFALWSMIPQMNKNEDSTGDLYNFIACLQDSLDVALCSIDEWIKIIDPDNAPIRFVDQMLIDLGNPFECPLTDIEKRKLVKLLIPIYLQKGTCNGIVNVVRFLLNLEGIDCDEYNCTEEPDETTTCVWTLGESFLPDDASPDDGDTILGTSVPYLLYSFKIKSDTILTEDQRNKIKIIVDYMKPAHTHCLGIVDPSTSEDEIDHLELGLSQLGVNWTLH